jgi:hypothetical protein
MVAYARGVMKGAGKEKTCTLGSGANAKNADGRETRSMTGAATARSAQDAKRQEKRSIPGIVASVSIASRQETPATPGIGASVRFANSSAISGTTRAGCATDATPAADTRTTSMAGRARVRRASARYLETAVEPVDIPGELHIIAWHRRRRRARASLIALAGGAPYVFRNLNLSAKAGAPSFASFPAKGGIPRNSTVGDGPRRGGCREFPSRRTQWKNEERDPTPAGPICQVCARSGTMAPLPLPPAEAVFSPLDRL